MADVLEDAAVFLAETLKEHASRTVTYKRDMHSVVMQATVGRTQLQLEDEEGGTSIEWTDRDFIFTAADLVLEGKPAMPEKGDVILETVGGETKKYQLMVRFGEPLWRWSDPHRVGLRVHTKEIK